MRGYSEALWCVRKHLSLALVHSGETLQKLARECRHSVCSISEATRNESDAVLRNLLAAEEHLVDEILPQLKDEKTINKLWLITDKIRSIRQEMTKTNLMFYGGEQVIKVPYHQMLGITKEIDSVIKEVDTLAPMMKQEQIKCTRCSEDLTSALGMFLGRVVNFSDAKVAKDLNTPISDSQLGETKMALSTKDVGVMAGAQIVGRGATYLYNAVDDFMNAANKPLHSRPSTWLNIGGGLLLSIVGLNMLDGEAQLAAVTIGTNTLSKIVDYTMESMKAVAVAPPAPAKAALAFAPPRAMIEVS